MSEPASLYARLTFDPDAFQGVLQSRLAPPSGFTDWQAWCDRHDMAGGNRVPVPLAETDAASIAGLFEGWQQDARSGTAPIAYDPANGTCRIAMLQASENVHEMLHLLAPLRGAATWTRPGSDDVIAILDFLWGDGGTSAYLTLGDGGSRILRDAMPDAHRAEAIHHLERTLERFQQAG